MFEACSQAPPLHSYPFSVACSLPSGRVYICTRSPGQAFGACRLSSLLGVMATSAAGSFAGLKSTGRCKE